jgi:hypothetical protein
MRNYFNIPNPMAFSNVTQDNGRVIKGSAIMGFSSDPKNILDDAAGDLRTMGCSLFYKKCQEVDTLSKLILLGVPNSIEEDVIKETLDNVLSTLEGTLLQTDKDYKLSQEQRSRWINFAVTKEFPPGMPWEDAEEKKKKQGGNNARLAYVLQVHQPDYDRISKLCIIAKQRKLWANHWGNTAFTVEIPDNESQPSEKVRYIQMVQTHGSVQLSLGAAPINGVIDADSTFSLRLTPGADGSPRAATQTSIRDVFRMMEVKSRKVWICLAKGSTGKYTGYFSSVVESINDHVKNFVACPGAQVYWWLRRRGCLAEDVNRMIRHCFTLDQQQKITKSKYMPNKGYAVLDESNSDDIINAVEEEGIYDTTLGLSERERRSAMAGRGYDASEIMFGEAKEGAMEAHNFSSNMSVTTIHSKNVNDTTSVASQKTLAKSVYSVDTSKVTSDGSDEAETDDEEEEDSNHEGSNTKTSTVEIEGMQMLTRERSKNNSNGTGQTDKLRNYQRVHATEHEAHLTKDMSNATEKLNLSSVSEGNMDEGEEADDDDFDDAMDSEEHSEMDTTYAIQRINLPDLTLEVDPDSDDEEGEDFSDDDLSVHPEDHSLGQDYESASEVESGVFDANYSNAFEEPNTFKELLWNIAGPSVGSMTIFLDLLKDDLKAEEAGLPAGLSGTPANLLALLTEEAGKEHEEQIRLIDEILEALNTISNSNSYTETPNTEVRTNEEASKTQGTLPGAQKANLTEEAAAEPVKPAGRDKEGAQSMSMVPTG